MSPLHCQHITCRRPSWNDCSPRVVENFSGSFESGTATAFQGAGDGATALLLSILGMIEPPDSGTMSVLGQSVLEMDPDAVLRLRDVTVGYLFTHPHLLPSFTVAENIAMPYLRLRGNSIEEARARVAEVLETAELAASCANLAIGELDEPSQWRVAFARSIVHGPKILVAVSPPAAFLLSMARRYARATGAVVLWNAGKEAVSGHCDRILVPDGRKIPVVSE